MVPVESAGSVRVLHPPQVRCVPAVMPVAVRGGFAQHGLGQDPAGPAICGPPAARQCLVEVPLWVGQGSPNPGRPGPRRPSPPAAPAARREVRRLTLTNSPASSAAGGARSWLGTVDASGARSAAVPPQSAARPSRDVERLVSVSKARAVDAEVDLLPGDRLRGQPVSPPPSVFEGGQGSGAPSRRRRDQGRRGRGFRPMGQGGRVVAFAGRALDSTA